MESAAVCSADFISCILLAIVYALGIRVTCETVDSTLSVVLIYIHAV